MSAEIKDCYVRPRRAIFLAALTSVALVGASFAIPAKALDAVPADDSWQVAAEAASASPAELKAEVADGELRMVVVRDAQGQPDVSVINMSSSGQLDQTLNALNADPSVISLEVDKKVNLLSTVTTASTLNSAVRAYNQWNYTALRLAEIQRNFTGSGIKVAVIDTGVDRTGTDLNNPNQVLDGCDWVTSPNNTCVGTGVVDENGHGTHVAGIIGAQADGEGITGVSPGVQIIPLRVLDADGNGYLSDISAAIDYAVDAGAKVINLSLGGTTDDYLIKESINRAVNLGVIVVAAAGNSGPFNILPSYPAFYSNVIAVAATDSNGVVASYSNQGTYLDIAAPGSAIISTYRGTYASLSGTSMASPHIAGIVALMLEKGILPANINNALESSADNLAPKNDRNRYGAGLVNAYAALGCDLTSCTAPVPGPTPTETLASTVLINPGTITSPSPTPEPAPIVETAPVIAIPTIKESLNVKVTKKRKLTVEVTAPTGTKTWVQRKSGKKWNTVLKITTTPSVVIKLGRSGTYRVQVIAPSEKVTSKSYKVK